VANVLRQSLFQDADLPSLAARMRDLTADGSVHPIVDLYTKAFGYSTTSRWTWY
jgi:hypothetical protein